MNPTLMVGFFDLDNTENGVLNLYRFLCLRNSAKGHF